MLRKIIAAVRKRGLANSFYIVRDRLQSRFGFLLRRLHSTYDKPQQERLSSEENHQEPLRSLFNLGYAHLGKCESNLEKFFPDIRSDLDHEQQRAPNMSLIVKLDDPLIKYPAIASVINHSNVISLVRNYIGEDATFDWMQVWRVIGGRTEKSTSGQWHHDRVGNRLKIFLYLSDTTGDKGLYTLYAAGTNKGLRQNFGEVNSREGEPESSSIVKLRANVGEMIIFDTNGSHSGVYDKGFDSRDVIQFEFSSREKSRRMPAWADIGPRGIILSSDAFALLNGNPLLDHSALTKLDEARYRYERTVRA